MKNQFETPLFDALKTYVENETIAFHVPGHKKGQGMHSHFRDFVGDNVLSMDVTVFKSVDSLHNPRSVIKRAQELAAEAYGSDSCFFSVHGTSGAIQVMIMSVVGFGDKILVPRNVHKSVTAGIILSGCHPIYMQPEVDDVVGVALNVTPEMVKTSLEEHPDAKAVLIINPTYYGVTTDIEKIAAIAHGYSIPLIVDEAHGPHLKFSDKLPISAMEAGADMCAQSTHKLVGALTQGSLLHVRGTLIDVNRVKSLMNMMHTTSPSYILMASLDVARMQMVKEGKWLLEQTVKLAHHLRYMINTIPGLYCFGEEVLSLKGAYGFDPTKITINSRGIGLSGYDLEKMLAENYKIQVELSDMYNVLAVVTIGDTEDSVSKLYNALKSISDEMKQVYYLERPIELPKIPLRTMSPREAYYSCSKRMPLDESVGEICAEMIMAYPPGIPIITQGEIISDEIIRYIKVLKMAGLDIQGTEDPDVNHIKVVEQAKVLKFVPTA